MFKTTNRKKLVAGGIFAALLVLSALVLTGTVGAAAEKMEICHCTGSDTNPIEVIWVSVNAWDDDGGRKHGPHHECTASVSIPYDTELIDGMCGDQDPGGG